MTLNLKLFSIGVRLRYTDLISLTSSVHVFLISLALSFISSGVGSTCSGIRNLLAAFVFIKPTDRVRQTFLKLNRWVPTKNL